MNKDIEITYRHDDYLIATKRATALSQGSSDGDMGLHERIMKNTKGKSHLLTRLDRPVSGVMLFSLSPGFTKHYLAQQEKGLVQKEYVAIVEGQLKQEVGQSSELIHHHVHDKKNLKARLSDEPGPKTTPVTLSYTVLDLLDRYTVLKVLLPKGRFHQIRVQLAHTGFPIKGDVKYGARRGNRDRSIHLHSHSIQFVDRGGNKQRYIAPTPAGDTLWSLAQTHLDTND